MLLKMAMVDLRESGATTLELRLGPSMAAQAAGVIVFMPARACAEGEAATDGDDTDSAVVTEVAGQEYPACF